MVHSVEKYQVDYVIADKGESKEGSHTISMTTPVPVMPRAINETIRLLHDGVEATYRVASWENWVAKKDGEYIMGTTVNLDHHKGPLVHREM